VFAAKAASPTSSTAPDGSGTAFRKLVAYGAPN
jgi:hypothetical protein